MDALRHLLVRSIYRETLALQQQGTVIREAALHAMDTHTIRDIRHPEGARHLIVGHRLLLVEHRQQRAQENEAAARIKHLMGIGNKVGGDFEFLPPANMNMKSCLS